MTEEEAMKCLNKGRDYLNEGETQLAWNEYNKVETEIFDSSIKAEAIFGEGVVYAIERNYSAAIDKFEKVLTVNPNHPNAMAYREKARQAWYSR